MATEGKSATERNGGMPMRSRRKFLALGGTAVAAAGAAIAGAGMPGKATEAAPGDPMILGMVNDAGDQQTLLVAAVGGPPQPRFGLVVSSGGGGVAGVSANYPGEDPPGGSGTGVVGRSGSGQGVFGSSVEGQGLVGATNGQTPATAWGVAGLSFKPGVDPTDPASYGVHENLGPGIGVLGEAGSGPGVAGVSVGGMGVFGKCDNQTGVHGVTTGEAEPAVGVIGYSLKPGVDPGLPESYVPENFGSGGGVVGVSGSGAGVRAISVSGRALDVQGAAYFATAGAGVIGARWRKAAVVQPAVTAQSHVTVTLTDDPGGAAVEWVERQAGVGFVVHMTGRVKAETGFTYLVVEPTCSGARCVGP